MKKIVLTIVIVVVFALFYLSKYLSFPIRYWDEHYWVAKSVQGEIYNKRDPLWDNFWSYDQPPVMGYINYFILGKAYQNYSLKNESFSNFLLRHSFSLYERESIPTYWEDASSGKFLRSPDELRSQYGKIIEKTIALIFVVRKYNAVILAVCLGFIFLLSEKYSHNLIVSLVTTILYGINLNIVTNGLLAHADAFFLTLLNLNILLFMMVRNKRNLILTGFLALFSALLFQTKINGIMIMMFIVLYFSFHKQWGKVLIFSYSFLLFSILLNPTLMHWDFAVRLFHYFDVRQLDLTNQIKHSPSDYIPNIWIALRTFFKHYFLGTEHSYYNISLPQPWMYIILFCSFFVGLIKQWKFQPITVTLFVWILVIVLSYLQLDWERYWLPLTFFVYYFEISGIFSIINWVTVKIKTRTIFPKLRNII